MKKLILVVAMVLLSTAAWGETKEICYDRWSTYQLSKHPVVPADLLAYILQWCTDNPPINSGVSSITTDPTAWHQTVSKYGAEPTKFNWGKDCELDCRLRCANSEGIVNPYCKSACIGRCEADRPWADSRYRLEKNEVTVRLRIIHFNVYANEWQEEDLDIDKKGNVIRNEAQMIEILDKYRKEEAIHRSWRPIK